MYILFIVVVSVTSFAATFETHSERFKNEINCIAAKERIEKSYVGLESVKSDVFCIKE